MTAFSDGIASRARATMVDHGLDPAPYADVISAYANAREDMAYLRAQWEDEGKPQYALGSTGALVAHPMLKAIREAEAHALAIGKTLGITPESYASMTRSAGRPQGASQAPDRQLRRAA